MIVMAIAGIWHGNTWGFLIWGGIHGLALVIHRINHSATQRVKLLQGFWANPLGILVSWALTQGVVFFSWLFFAGAPAIYPGVAKAMGVRQDAPKGYVESLGLSAAELWGLLVLLSAGMAMPTPFSRACSR
jgi:alginate O-acetyltransferase complex protein AlgI